MRMRKIRGAQVVAALVIASFLPLATTGCLGGFNLTQQLFQFNKDTSPNRWVQEGVFILLIIPYGVTLMLDAVVFNSIEWWTGNNPITEDIRKTVIAKGCHFAGYCDKDVTFFLPEVAARSASRGSSMP